MEEFIDFAIVRYGETVEEIEMLRTQIAKLEEHKEDLEVFVATGKDLIELAAAKRPRSGATSLDDSRTKSNIGAERIMPVRDAIPA